MRSLPHATIGALCGLLLAGGLARADAPTLLRTPDDGIQPQAAVDGKGVLHLIYFKGKDSAGDLFYVRREPGQAAFSRPIRVNSDAGSAIALGSVRGAHLAVGKDGRPHVAWNGSGQAKPKAPNDTQPMLYSRLDDAGKAFEPQRNLMTKSFGLDGGGSVAADADGNVYVAWCGNAVGRANDEKTRQVWVARSADNGKTFGEEVLASTEPTGACGCCGMRAGVDAKGGLHLLYRSAREGVDRDTYLLTSADRGKTFESRQLAKWKANQCVMSTYALGATPTAELAAWENERQIFFARITPGKTEMSRPVRAPGEAGKAKHPAVAGNDKGETVLAWTEGTDWNKGGALAYAVFDADGKLVGRATRSPNAVPVWGLPTAVADKDGKFIIIY